MYIKRIYFRAILLLVGLLVFSCQEDKRIDIKKELQQEREQAFSQKMELPLKKDVALTEETKSEVLDWPEYIAAREEVARIGQSSIQNVVENAKILQQNIQELEATLPKTLQTKPVLSRINVLISLTNVLVQTGNNPLATAEDVENTAQKIPVAFENFKIQLNETFRIEIVDFELEEKIEPKTSNEPVLDSALQKPTD